MLIIRGFCSCQSLAKQKNRPHYNPNPKNLGLVSLFWLNIGFSAFFSFFKAFFSFNFRRFFCCFFKPKITSQYLTHIFSCVGFSKFFILVSIRRIRNNKEPFRISERIFTLILLPFSIKASIMALDLSH